MKTQNSITVRILAFISLAAFPAGAQWIRWDTSVGGNSHWYKAVQTTNAANWTQVDELARAEGGYLATITSSAENDFVFSLINFPKFFQGIGGNGAGPAIGGFQPEGSPEPGGGWSWVTGESWGYVHWTPPTNGFSQMPDNAGGNANENRLHFFSGAQGIPAPTWNDLPDWDGNLGGYVIESDSTPRPVLSIHQGGDVCWMSVTNIQYQLQWVPLIDSTNWMSLGPVVVGTGAVICTSDSTTDQGQRFYRVRMLP